MLNKAGSVAVKAPSGRVGLKKQARRMRAKGLFGRIWQYRLSYLFIAPFMLCFIAFILIPVIAAIGLSFTYFNAIEAPRFIGWQNFQYLLSQDLLFLKHALPNTFVFALIVGPGGYAAAFLLAWLITQLPEKSRRWYALAMYTPSLTAGIAMSIVWLPMLSGDRIGYLNSLLLQLGLIEVPKLWVTDKDYLMNSMIVVTLWSSMGVGFLAMLAGLLGVNKELYEAGKLDGICSRLQEIWHITIPSMKPQMLFGAVMAIVATFKAGAIGVELSGVNPTPEYAGHLIINHIEDYGFIRFEMGYAAAISVFLLILMYASNKLSWSLFGSKEGE
ncbi:binding-protein-dependent transport systems inner membrane component [Paenibacillus mucilaginosus 3016]|uniref:Binding-protein-dependent transport systems inner membrane component n=1 Tax=Paenibacillus mucilaginosus 3016 TaxID=1116391 RepID=H6NFV3_9BACL|nr:sugar ABC transporter permease [Paenibacillus mucilaginosus]AFC30743.1 binding-protein-dependent transport systems inner membrane component [Paenibacillus mucilaginosus 3016]WFA19349.1 sugar ABC transporter permease [Paenibacillus mucilaginosus]